jgi:hypothetical protein
MGLMVVKRLRPPAFSSKSPYTLRAGPGFPSGTGIQLKDSIRDRAWPDDQCGWGGSDDRPLARMIQAAQA